MSHILARRRWLHAPAIVLLCCALLVAFVAPPASAAPAQQTGIPPEKIAALEAVLDRTIANPNIPGVMLHVIVEGQGSWAGARGVANRETGQPLGPNDRFRFASNTKIIVATVVLQLLEEGHLTLNDTVERWLPGLVPGGDGMNIRQLLTHTSGLPDYMDGPFMRMTRDDPGRIWQPEEMVQYALGKRRVFNPGASGRWFYSNTNYVLLGLIVERATGQSLEHEVQWRILDRIGMSQTNFDPGPEKAGTLVHGYAGWGDMSAANLSFAWAAGGIVSTPDEMARFGHALFGGKLLRPETFATMRGFVPVSADWARNNLVYGLGMMQKTLRAGGPDAVAATVWGHTGALNGYRSAVWFVPEYGITIVVAANQMSVDPSAIAAEAFRAVLIGK
ncbi:MAG: beta-lactamase family protein [Chloroflexaceae bacterium]|jgi:D-alanyl-D-alanine carboxypeptidase|nr:beta-lactamase family protein [Chloroflexaceae bacterium]